MAGWENFFIAEAGASAALAGLVFVGISINLSKILSNTGLPGRALEALIVLVAILVASSLMLVPDQSQMLAGAELLLVSLVEWQMLVTVEFNYTRIARDNFRKYRRAFLFRVILSQIASVPMIIAGALVFFGNWGGLYWLVPAFMFSIFMALTNSWVLVIEINR